MRTLRRSKERVNVRDKPPPERRVRLPASARRAQLAEVGRRVFAQRGYEAASVEEIAERAGITKPVVYEHFGGKEGLYAVVVDREVEHIVSRIVEAISDGSPRERLEQAALAFLRYVKERPEGFTVLLRDTPALKGTGEMPGLMYDLADRVGAIFTQQFGKAGYDVKAAPIYSHALVGMVAFVGQWWTESRKAPRAEAVASHIAALAWMGLRRLPRRPLLLAAPGRS
jgi:AcrR family transcriptional regulator